jgi:hypothetical protein
MKTLIQLQNERAQIESRNNQFATKIKNNEALTADELTEMRGLTAKLDALEQDIADAKAADEIVKRAAAAEAKRVAGLGVGGKVKHYGGKALGVAGKLGGAALTASYVLPSLMSLMPQKPQPEQEPPY